MNKFQDILHSRKFRNICGLIAIILLIVVISYIVTSCTQFTNNGLIEKDFYGKIYISSDGILELSLSENGAWFVTEKALYDFDKWSYEESVLILTNDKTTFYFWALEDGRVFSREERVFLYEVIS